jgi:His-Xaa-Ser system protein HxsD
MSVDILPRANETECILHFNPGQTNDDAERIVAAFRSEVLDQDLRSIIAKETEGVRNAVLAFALSKTSIASPTPCSLAHASSPGSVPFDTPSAQIGDTLSPK